VAATATARKSASRRAPSKRPTQARRRPAAKPAPRRRAQPTPIPGRLVPLAVGRTAHAVGGIADSGLVMRLTRGRLWIGALAALLVGIVALNVMALSFNASSSKSAGAADGLERQNSALRAQLAEQLSNDRIQQTASILGLIVPEAGAVRYLRPSADDAAEAARRLRAGELSGLTAAPPPVTQAPVTATAPPPSEPAAPESPVAGPAVEAPAEAVTPAAPQVGSPAPAGGGVASP
jgi:hypothetical protein